MSESLVKRGKYSKRMPLRRRPARVRPAYVNRGFSFTPPSLVQAARVVANMRTGGFVGLEFKFYDVGGAATLTTSTDGSLGTIPVTVPAAPPVLCLNGMATGNTATTRDGRQITSKSIFVSGSIYPTSTYDTVTPASVSDGRAPTFFVALVLDTQNNGSPALPNSELVFVNPCGSEQVADAPMRNLQWTKRFRVLASTRLRPSSVSLTVDSAAPAGKRMTWAPIPFRLASKLGFKQNFTGDSAGIANISDNSIFLVCYAASYSTANLRETAPHIRYNSRFRFTG